MRIKSVEVKNYRSLGDEQTKIYFNSPMICLIGKNEAGKSNILKALGEIRFFTNMGDQLFKARNKNPIPQKDVVVNLDIEFDLGDIKQLCDNSSKTYQSLTTSFSFFRQETGYPCMTFNGILSDIIRADTSLVSMRDDLLGELNKMVNLTNNKDWQNVIKWLTEFDRCYVFWKYNDFTSKKETLDKIKAFRGAIEKHYVRFKSILPVFFGFQNVFLKDSYTLQELQNGEFYKHDVALLRYLGAIGVSQETFISACNGGQSRDEQSSSKNLLNQKNAEFSEDFSKWYTVEGISLVLDIDSGVCYFNVNNTGTHRVFPLSERSTGLNWFLNVYMEIKRAGSPQNAVLLIDEPAASLHVNLQKKVLTLLEELSRQMTIIYTTHSPYMINPDKLVAVRGVVKNDGFSAVRDIPGLTSDSCNTEVLSSVCEALDCSLRFNIGPACGRVNLVVEGITDYYYINAMLDSFGVREESRPNIIPCVGADNVPNVVSILLGWGCKVKALFDSDRKGRDNFNRVVSLFAADENIKEYVFLLSENQTAEVRIEDLLAEPEKNLVQSINGGKSLQAKLFCDYVRGGEHKVSSETLRNYKRLFERMDIPCV